MRIILNFHDNVSTFIEHGKSIEKRQNPSTLLTIAFCLYHKGWIRHEVMRRDERGMDILDRVIMMNPIMVIS